MPALSPRSRGVWVPAQGRDDVGRSPQTHTFTISLLDLSEACLLCSDSGPTRQGLRARAVAVLPDDFLERASPVELRPPNLTLRYPPVGPSSVKRGVFMNLRRRQMNPRLARSRVSFRTSLNNFCNFGGRVIEQTIFNQHKRNRRQAAEIQNALAVTCGAVIVCAFALRNGFLSDALQLDAAYSELDVDELIGFSFLASIPTVLLAHRYHGPMRLNRSAEDEEGNSIF